MQVSVVSVILLAPYSKLQSYSCIVNFVRKMKQPAQPGPSVPVIYHQKRKSTFQLGKALEKSPCSPNLSCLSPISSPFFLGPAWQSGLKIGLDRQLQKCILTFSSGLSHHHRQSITLPPLAVLVPALGVSVVVLLCATNPYFNLKLHRKRELSTTTVHAQKLSSGSRPLALVLVLSPHIKFLINFVFSFFSYPILSSYFLKCEECSRQQVSPITVNLIH